MIKVLVRTSAMALALAATGAMAQPTPQLQDADPLTIDPAGPAEVMLTLYGEDLPPDCCNHPDYTEYWHIFVRNVDANGAAGPWVHCDGHDGCGMHSFNSSQMTLRVSTARWAKVAGATFQMHYYNGLDDSGATDPSVNKYRQALSGWSNVWSWKVMSPPAAVAPPAHPALIARARQLPRIEVPPVPAIHPQITATPIARAVRPGVVPSPALQRPKIVPPPIRNR